MKGYDVFDSDGRYTAYTAQEETARGLADQIHGFYADSDGWYYDSVTREYRPMKNIQAAHS